MSTIEQYLVRDSLSEDSTDRRVFTTIGPIDPYARHVRLFSNHHLALPHYSPQKDGLVISQMMSGYNVTPAALLSPGRKNFCVELFFSLPGTYSSGVHNQLKMRDEHPIFCIGSYPDVHGTPGTIKLYIPNEYAGLNVGLNGLHLHIVDDNQQAFTLAASPANFLAWLNSGQYKSVVFGRTNDMFFLYLNGELKHTTVYPGFGSINILESSVCHILGFPEHGSLYNSLTGLRVTCGVSRVSGQKHFFINGFAPKFTNIMEPIEGNEIEENLYGDHSYRGGATNTDILVPGSLFSFLDIENISTNFHVYYFKSIKSSLSPDTLTDSTTGVAIIDGLRGLKFSGYGILKNVWLSNFSMFFSLSIENRLAVNQEFVELWIEGPYPKEGRMLKLYYNNGAIRIRVVTVSDYQEELVQLHDSSIQLKENGCIVGISRGPLGLYVICNDTYYKVTYPSSYYAFTTNLFRINIGKNCPNCRFLEFYYTGREFSEYQMRAAKDLFTAKSELLPGPLDEKGFALDFLNVKNMFSFSANVEA